MVHRRVVNSVAQACDKAVNRDADDCKKQNRQQQKCSMQFYHQVCQYRAHRGCCLFSFLGITAVVAVLCWGTVPMSSLWRIPFMSRHEYNREIKRNYWNYYVPILPWNPIYHSPDAHERLGDRSDGYASLRKEIDAILDDPVVFAKQLSLIESSKRTIETVPTFDASYDRYNCPNTPPEGYPFLWKTLDIVTAWNPKNTTVPSMIHNSLCVFDFDHDYHKAINYKAAGLPFLVVNDPAVVKTTVRWSLPNYVKRLMGKNKHSKYAVKKSKTARFLYFDEKKWLKEHRGNQQQQHLKGSVVQDEQAPTTWEFMTYEDFESRARSSIGSPEDTHWYLQTEACGWTANDGSCLLPTLGQVEFYFDEMPFLQPHVKHASNDLYRYRNRKTESITCRFGQEGNIFEPHFDSGPNALIVLKGSRRYILAPPRDCSHLALYPSDHSSARHSAVDFSHPDLQQFPQFAQSQSLEVVMQAGEALFLPPYWFHYIISLDFNAQCNGLNDNDHESKSELQKCGYYTKK